MKINWQVRLQSGSFWVAMLGAVIAFGYQICGILGVVPPVSEDQLTQLVGIIINILVGLGIIIDPTTAGLGDSQRVLKYKTPNKDV